MCQLFVSLLIVIGISYGLANEKVILCYYGTWATYRSGLGKFDVSDIAVNLCTHLVYTFAGINSKGEVISLDPYLDLPDNWGLDNFGKFNALKSKNPNLKTLLAVGGWNEGSAKYSIMAADATLRKNFITSASNTVRKYKFDGLDLDWEYPNRRDSVHGWADVNNYSQLLKEIREEFDKYGLLLTAAVSPVESAASMSYDIPTISQYLDFINVMAYDMYGPWDPVTGHNAPLHRGVANGDTPKENLNTVDVAIEYWINSGCPPEKLVLGVPFYGHTFKLANANVNSVGAASNGPGIAGPYTSSSGSIGYNEFCYKLQTETWQVQYDDLAKVPYAVRGTDWVSYDNADSIIKKIQYGLQYNIAGVMIWSIETDDFHGICHTQNFPLLKAVNLALNSASVVNTTTSTISTTSSTTTSTTSRTTTWSTTAEKPTSSSTTSTVTSITSGPSTPQSNICSQVGLADNPNDCSTFYLCVEGNYGLIPVLFKCPGDLLWDPENLHCNYQELVKCNT